MRVLITGGSGLIGRALTQRLIEKGYDVATLSRSPKNRDRIRVYSWNVEKGTMDLGAIENTDFIIHLAGEGIASKRWTPERKKEIINSRTQSIRLIYKTLSQNPHSVKACISSGGIGYYGDRGESWLVEEDKPGNGFLSESCIEWEKAVLEGESLGIRIAQFRLGMVLSREGGGLKPLEKLNQVYLGSPLGNGKQWLSWIHIDDVCRIFIKALESQDFTGIINGVAPMPVTNAEFSTSLAKAMHKTILSPPAPEGILKLVLGEMSSVILDSTRVQDKKLESLGFEFQFKTLERAFQNLFPN